MQRSRHVAIVDEEIFLDVERLITAFQITGAVIINTVPQYQILRACRSPNRIGLQEAHSLQRPVESCRLGKIPRNGESSQVVDCDRHWTRISGFTELTGC